MFKSHRSFSKGFTLVELMIVMTIVGIITFSIISTFSSQRASVQYNEEVVKVNSLVKLARNYASTNRSVYDGEGNFVPKEGYGIYLERSATPGQSKLILFANTSADTPEKALQYDEGDIIEEEFFLAKEAIMETIFLTQLGPPPINTEVDRAVILFATSSAKVNLYNNADPNDITEMPIAYHDLEMNLIRLGDDSENSRKTFTLNKTAGVPEMSL